MSLVDFALYGVVIPALVAAVVLAVAVAITGRAGAPPSGDWKADLALGAGYLAGHAGIAGIAWPWSDVTDRLPVVALAATALGILDAWRPGPAWTRWENRLLFGAMAVVVMLGPSVQEDRWTRPTLLRLAGLTAIVALSWANLDFLAGRMTGASIALPTFALAGGASAVLLLSGSMVLGRLGGALTVALAAAWLVSMRFGGLALARGGVAVVTLVLAALLLEGHVYSLIPAPRVALVAASPLMIHLTRIGPIRRRAPWQVGLIGAMVVLVPIGVAVASALMEERSPEGY